MIWFAALYQLCCLKRKGDGKIFVKKWRRASYNKYEKINKAKKLKTAAMRYIKRNMYMWFHCL